MAKRGPVVLAVNLFLNGLWSSNLR